MPNLGENRRGFPRLSERECQTFLATTGPPEIETAAPVGLRDGGKARGGYNDSVYSTADLPSTWLSLGEITSRLPMVAAAQERDRQARIRLGLAPIDWGQQ